MRTLPRLGRILACALPLLALGCTGRQDTDDFSRVTLLRCTPQTQSVAEAVAETEGDSLAVRGHKLVLPPGSLSIPTKFTMTARTDGYVGVEITSRLSTFVRPAQLTLSYAHCGPLPMDSTTLKIYYVRGERVIAEIRSQPDFATKTVTTWELGHLSGYLIGGT
jgi:hypothetical protein